MIRAPLFLVSLLCIARVCFSSNPEIEVSGVVADFSGHTPLSSVAITVQGYTNIGGIMFQDSAFSDSQGAFQMTLLTSNRYSPSLTLEKDGYKTLTLTLPPLAAQAVSLDTVFLAQYTPLDSVTYSVSGSVSDAVGNGVRGAMLTLTLSQGASTILSVEDSTSQGGYFSISCRRPYQKQAVAADLRVEKSGFAAVDVSQSLASSTQIFIFNLVLNKSPASVLSRAGLLTKGTPSLFKTFSVNGRRYSAAAGGACEIVRIPQSGIGCVTAQLK